MNYPFFRGVRKDKDAQLLDQGELSDMNNLMADTGVLKKRPGVERIHDFGDLNGNIFYPVVIIPEGGGGDGDDDDEWLEVITEDGDDSDSTDIDSEVFPPIPPGFITDDDDDDDNQQSYLYCDLIPSITSDGAISKNEEFTLTIQAEKVIDGTVATGFDEGSNVSMSAYIVDNTYTSRSATILASGGGAVDFTTGWSSGVWTGTVQLTTTLLDADTYLVIGITHYGDTYGWPGMQSRTQYARDAVSNEAQAGNIKQIILERQKAAGIAEGSWIDLEGSYNLTELKAYVNAWDGKFLDGSYTGGASSPTLIDNTYADSASTEADLATLCLALTHTTHSYTSLSADEYYGYSGEAEWGSTWTSQKSTALANYAVSGTGTDLPYAYNYLYAKNYGDESSAAIYACGADIRVSGLTTEIGHSMEVWIYAEEVDNDAGFPTDYHEFADMGQGVTEDEFNLMLKDAVSVASSVDSDGLVSHNLVQTETDWYSTPGDADQAAHEIWWCGWEGTDAAVLMEWSFTYTEYEA